MYTYRHTIIHIQAHNDIQNTHTYNDTHTQSHNNMHNRHVQRINKNIQHTDTSYAHLYTQFHDYITQLNYIYLFQLYSYVLINAVLFTVLYCTVRAARPPRVRVHQGDRTAAHTAGTGRGGQVHTQ